MAAQLKPGVLLRGKWRLDHFLGRGGMSSVYAATHRNGMRGAIKVLHREFNDNDTVKKRFMREGYVANKVEHPGSVRVLDDDETEDGHVFLVMELLEGTTLKKRWIDCDRRMEVPVVMEIMDQVLDVLESAHKNKIVHRDLKPDNVFILENGSAKVLDFGIARVLEATLAGSADATSSAAMMGTPAFMPPEQALAHWSKVDGRSDLFALAATAYTVLSGRLIHSGSTMPELLVAAATQQVDPIRTLMPDLDEGIAAVIDRGLRFEIAERWPDARSMRLALLQAKTKVAGNRTVRLQIPMEGPATIPTSSPAPTSSSRPAPITDAMETVLPSTEPIDSGSEQTVMAPSSPKAVTQLLPAIAAPPPAALRVVSKTTPHPRVVHPGANPRTMQSEVATDRPNPPTAVWDATPVRLQAPMRPEHVAQLAKVTVGDAAPRNNKALATWVVGGVSAVAVLGTALLLQSTSPKSGSESSASSAPGVTVALPSASATTEAPLVVPIANPPASASPSSSASAPLSTVVSVSARPPTDKAPPSRPVGAGPCLEYDAFTGKKCIRRQW